jgi:hypothetical protein
MKLRRRTCLYFMATAVTFLGAVELSWGQSYPSHPVRIVIGFAAGGAPDIAARLVAHALSERLGPQFIVENQPGAGSKIATRAVLDAPADGYTLLLVTTANAANATLYERLTLIVSSNLTDDVIRSSDKVFAPIFSGLAISRSALATTGYGLNMNPRSTNDWALVRDLRLWNHAIGINLDRLFGRAANQERSQSLPRVHDRRPVAAS